MRIKILKDDPDFSLKKGEIYEAKSYWLDPQSKIELISRIPDGFDPCCTVYRQSVKVLKNKVKGL